MLSVSLMQAESMIGLLSNYITRIVPLLQRREVVHNNITPLSKLFWQRTDDGLGTSVIVNDPQPRLSAFFFNKPRVNCYTWPFTLRQSFSLHSVFLSFVVVPPEWGAGE